jgi:hypothetical protein
MSDRNFTEMVDKEAKQKLRRIESMENKIKMSPFTKVLKDLWKKRD